MNVIRLRVDVAGLGQRDQDLHLESDVAKSLVDAGLAVEIPNGGPNQDNDQDLPSEAPPSGKKANKSVGARLDEANS
jgi:hypothetical protein